jgi:hypothetical protein
MPARKLLLIEPTYFSANPETAKDNYFQQKNIQLSAKQINSMALTEFNSLISKLSSAGIECIHFRQEDDLPTPDAIYPNNWFSTHPGGKMILYPMKAENRRMERRATFIELLKINYPSLIDLSFYEKTNSFLEGTGSLVIDHVHKIVYASLSLRTDLAVLSEWANLLNFDLLTFTSYDSGNHPVYHTNVMMSVAEQYAIVCLDAIHNDEERKQVTVSLSATHHELIEISKAQMHRFCANCLEVQNKKNESILVMSENAYKNFTPGQLNSIQKFSAIHFSDITTIETFGGGGVRCMLAELF